MRTNNPTTQMARGNGLWKRLRAGGAALGAAMVLYAQAYADPGTLAVTVVDGAGFAIATPTGQFRWLLETDNTVQRPPGVATNDSVSLVVHQSHAPVAANGTASGNTVNLTVPDAAERYYLTVMAEGYAVGGQQIAPGQTTARVVLHQHPIPSSQISVFVFEDSNSINNVPDATELGLGGFRVIIIDPLGAGAISQDAFGNPLGTTYEFDPTSGDVMLEADGSPKVMMKGDGNLYTDSNGRVQIKYIPPGKFGVQVIPPMGTHWQAGHGSVKTGDKWNQTSTIEGTLTVDAWVKANEPAVWVEGFGVGFYHVFFGFVNPANLVWATNAPPASADNATLTGQLRYNHFGRPPNNQMNVAGAPVPEGWVGLNEMTLLPGGGIGPIGAVGRGLYAAQCDDSGNFTIPNVPEGTYQLVTWDKPLDSIFGFQTITVPQGGGNVNLGDVLCYRWFGTFQGSIFYDADQDGFRDSSEEGIPNMAVNLRFRDGRVYMGTVTDNVGDYKMQEVFPFFKWLVAEVDFSRFKATGLTSVTDEGGVIPGMAWPADGERNPQPQYEIDPATGKADPTKEVINPNTDDNLSRTVKGEALTQAMHLFLNQNNRIDWGKSDYAPGENGGISGIVFYSTTRAEEDPREAVGDPWEPGIPRVQVTLYQDANEDKAIDDLDSISGITLADVDNHPLGWADGGTSPGPEDRKFDPSSPNKYRPAVPGERFHPGDAIQITWTDAWDDNPPTAIEVDPPLLPVDDPADPNNKYIVGADSYAAWNQISDGVFDGGYAFGSYIPGGMANPTGPEASLPVGMYIVQAATPPGYLIQTEESMNVGWGDGYIPSKLWLPPELVGDLHTVPAELTLFPGVPAPFAGEERPLADRKWVMVSDRNNGACDFHMYTEVPKAARVVGFVLNDLSAEFNAYSPNFGEKASPGWLPISFRDWAGKEVARTYCDEYGTYNALIPSTYTVNAPAPSGVVPNMLTVVLNDPTMPDPTDPTGNTRIPDPNHNPNYGVSPSTWMFWPASVSYLDTPIVPLAGFTGYPNNQIDVEAPAGTPVIADSYTAAGGGPFLAAVDDVLTLESLGDAHKVPNPAYVLGGSEPTMIARDYSFGPNQGTRSVTINGTPMTIVSWNPATVQVRLPAGLNPGGGDTWQLMLKRGDTGLTTPIGLTLTYGLPPRGGNANPVPQVRRVRPRAATPSDPLPDPIQEAIDLAGPRDLILVTAGVYYENPILDKPLRLQGSGYRTVISANPVPTERANNWIGNITKRMGGNPFGANGSPGILALGSDQGPFSWVGLQPNRRPRIDGFQIVGAITGGGVMAYNFAENLRISNNRIVGNQGTSAGGISLGLQDNLNTVYSNEDVVIEYNQIFKNGGVNGAGGIAIHTGAEGYRIRNNYIIGNFSRVNGGGIGHEGLSRGGLIADNIIVNNEVFYGIAIGGDGGGIYLGGEIAPDGDLSAGAGSVSVLNNLIQGNLAGSGRGGGICVAGFNGLDVEQNRGQGQWYQLIIANNMIVNNTAGYQAGAIAIRDATRVSIIHNTIANNECTATAKGAFPAGQLDSDPQGAGIVTYRHTALLTQYSGQQYCNPELVNNIVWQNRSFFWNGTDQELVPATPLYRDFRVVTLAGGTTTLRLNPRNSLLTSLSGDGFTKDNSNKTGDPKFESAYVNTLFSAAVIDEAGNNISARFEPTGQFGDYHIGDGSPAINNAAKNTPVAFDFDKQPRPNKDADIGADEYSTAAFVVATWPNVSGNGPAPTGPIAGAPVIQPPGTPVMAMMQPVPEDLDGIDTDGDGIVTNDHRYVRLGAGDGFASMADGNELYTFSFSDLTDVPHHMAMMEGMLKAEVSAPTIVYKEGQKVYLDLVNVGMMMRPDLFDPHTIHFHGFPNAAVIFDGEPMGSVSINMGGTFRYFYNIVQPGTYLYHCHVEATEHMEMGMIGNLWVEPIQNNAATGAYPGHTKGVTKFAYNDGDGSTLYHVEAPLQMGAFDRNFHEKHIAVQGLPFWSLDESYPLINGRGYPDTVNPDPLAPPPSLAGVDPAWPSSQKTSALVTAQVGQKVLLRVSNVSLSDFHTLTVQGIPMKVVAKDAKLLRGPTGVNTAFTTSSVTLGGGETTDVILDTAGLAAGTYFIYDTRLNHLCNDEEDFGGIMTQLVLQP